MSRKQGITPAAEKYRLAYKQAFDSFCEERGIKKDDQGCIPWEFVEAAHSAAFLATKPLCKDMYKKGGVR